jgi:hypothetical protein
VVNKDTAPTPPTKWRKSSYSGDPSIGTCVEMATVDHLRVVRDSTDPEGPLLAFSIGEMRTLLESIKNRELEL